MVCLNNANQSFQPQWHKYSASASNNRSQCSYIVFSVYCVAFVNYYTCQFKVRLHPVRCPERTHNTANMVYGYQRD